MNNRDRILLSSIDLFNKSGVGPISTNHIAKHLRISPGNLYFHFSSKEEILQLLFKNMCDEIYSSMKDPNSNSSPRDLIQATFEVFWKYRFFHREMYSIRRKDKVVAQLWKSHITKTQRLLMTHYKKWVETGLMRKITDREELQNICDIVLIVSSVFLQFFETPEKAPDKKHVEKGTAAVMRFLSPYLAS